jgi:succinoglycan biosynthesis protein ExoA
MITANETSCDVFHQVRQEHIRQYPLVSLLVAMRNEAEHIGRCISSILAQDYPNECLEVLIFDGCSSDNSWQIVENLIKGMQNYCLLTNPDRIQSAAWNLGIQLSQGKIIGIISGHVELASDYISKAIETLQRTQTDMVGGPVQARSHDLLGDSIALAMSTPFGVGGAKFRYIKTEEETDTVFMGLCWRSLYLRIGGFDEELVRNQDDEFSYRLLQNGGRIVCNPSIRSYYYNRSTALALWRQYYQYGYWKVRVLQKHPRQMQPRQFVPPVFVTSLLGAALLSLFWSIGDWLLFTVVVCYLIANLSASLYTAWRRGWRFLFLLPIIYGILHLSYGLGFLVGLFHFANRWGDKRGKVVTWEEVKARTKSLNFY